MIDTELANRVDRLTKSEAYFERRISQVKRAGVRAIRPDAEPIN